MGQQEIFAFLKSHKNTWFTTRQISERLSASFGSVTTSLKRMRESRQVTCKKTVAEFSRLGAREVFTYTFKR
jgi:hypothetical protein